MAASASTTAISDLLTSSMADTLKDFNLELDSPQSARLLSTVVRLGWDVVSFLPGLIIRLATWVTITLPKWLFTFFSTSLTFTMNATTLLLLALTAVSLLSWFVRYRFLNVYARLPQEPQRKEPEIDLFPNAPFANGDSKPGLNNYLDEFLEAIKVFGYLERPVFHELTRTMQTRKLMAGETLLLEEEKGFCMVVDGIVQIFVQSKQNNSAGEQTTLFDEESSYHEGHQGYQLLTEVKNGASMSSLFSILSLFTEDVRLRHDSPSHLESSTGATLVQSPPGTPGSVSDSPSLPSTPQNIPGHTSHASNGLPATMPSRLPRVPPLSLAPPLDEQRSARGIDAAYGKSRQRRQRSVHPDIVARAMVDTTIAVIPATAFKRLTRTYPKATAHIVQVILTRLQRVTLSTAHQYLGLTTEVLQIEKLMNRYTSYDLPGHLRGDALERLKDKFSKERDRIGLEEGSKGIALHNPGTARRRSSTSLRKDAALAARIMASKGLDTTRPSPTGHVPAAYNPNVSAGDLAANVAARQPHRSNSLSKPRISIDTVAREGRRPSLKSPLEIREKPLFTPTLDTNQLHHQESLNEDSVFRESVLESLVMALGLDVHTSDGQRPGATSVEQSPRLVSYDAKRQTAIFNNAFGLMDAYSPGEADSETMSAVSTAVSTTGRTLQDELINDIEIVHFPKNSVLVEQGERNPGVYYVIDGFLDVSIPAEDGSELNRSEIASPPPKRKKRAALSRTNSVHPGMSQVRQNRYSKSLFLVKPGGIAGYIGTLSAYRSFTDVTAKTDVYVGFLPRASLERVAERFPIVLLTMAKRLTSLLPRLILHLDFALEWTQVNAGQLVYHQGDESDAIYIVLNGRLRAVREDEDGTMRATGEYGQGESIGELEVMTESARPANLHAIRDTELAKFPRSLFNSLAQEHPNITLQVSKLIAQRMRALIDDPMNKDSKERKRMVSANAPTSTFNLRTICVLPVTAGIPVAEFGTRLVTALTQIGVPGGVTLLNQAIILSHLGRHAFSRMGRLKLSQYLADLEEKYGMVLYIADTSVNAPWTQTCIAQADCILLVGLAQSSPAIGEFERFLLGMKTTARKELVLLHHERYSQPGLTRKWLQNRLWINGGHHHIHMTFRTGSVAPVHNQPRRLGRAIRQRVQVIQAEIQKYTSRRVQQQPLYSSDTPFKGDLHRLARRLCGRSVGLVLGGGGARGIAHVGVIRALEEMGIPIDIVGGTSIGSFIGALYARDADVVPMLGRAKKFAGRMASMWRFALDLTYPTASYTTGHEFNRGIFKTFGDSQIEDFWLPFYCNTTNISKSRGDIHTSGYAWRYVRASMSLAGLIPPICDEGNMLLDGGYVDNLTVAHMKSLGTDLIFAVDVGSLDDDTPQQFGDTLSGFWAVFQRWNPFSTIPAPPTLSEIQARLAYVSSVDALERAKKTPGCLYMRPPIDAYATLDFAKFDEIYEVGYAYAKAFLASLKDKGELKDVITEDLWTADAEKAGMRRTMAPRRASI